MKRGRPKCSICGKRFWCTHPRAAGACGKCFENPKRMRELLAKVQRVIPPAGDTEGERLLRSWEWWR